MVSPDAGGVERARAFAKRLDAIAGDHRQATRARQRSGRDAHRRRRRATASRSSSTTSSTPPARSPPRRRRCARTAPRGDPACCTHPVLSGPAIDAHPAIRRSASWSSPTPSRCGPTAQAVREDQGAVRRAPARRGDSPDPPRGIHQLAVRLSGSADILTPGSCVWRQLNWRQQFGRWAAKVQPAACANLARRRRCSTDRSDSRR